MSTIDPDKALEIVKKLSGPEGVIALMEQLNQREHNIRNQISQLGGALAELGAMKRLILGVASRWGLEGLPGTAPAPQPSSENLPTATPPSDDKALLAKRIAEGFCTFKSIETKRFCDRALRSKKEQACGYCKPHMKVVGIPDDSE